MSNSPPLAAGPPPPPGGGALPQLLTTAIEQAAEAIMITDAHEVIEYVNPAFERITGYTRAEAFGQRPRLLRSGQHDPTFYRALKATLAAGQVWRGEFVNRRKDGRLYHEKATISPVLDAHGLITHFVAVKRDATELAGLEEQLRQAQKMEVIGRLAGGVAHDFNNQLTVILGCLDLLELQLVETDPLRHQVAMMRNAAERSAALTRQLLVFSRKEALKPQALDLNALLRNLEKMVRRLIGEAITLVCEYDAHLPPLLADAGQFEQIVMNLAVNARDAMPQGGRLALRTARVPLTGPLAQLMPAAGPVTAGSAPAPVECIRFSVSDTGAGMDEEVRRRCIEPFFTTKPAGQGTGLGLFTVYGIVQQYRGHLEIVSAPGRGATFHLYFPAAAGGGEGVREEPPHEVPYGAETVLVVEDQPDLLEIACGALRLHGYRVLPARGSGEAMLLAEQNPGRIDLLVTDVVMPLLSGVELARRLRGVRPELRVLFISGYPHEEMARVGLSLHEVSFLPKPFRPGELVRKVREILDAPATAAP